MARASGVRVEGLRDARRLVDEVGERARALQPVLASPGVLREIHAAEQRRFAKRFKPASRRWVARKRREGLDTRTMHATGELRKTLTTGEPPAVVFRPTAAGLRWGLTWRSPVWYAAAQAARGRQSVVIDKAAKDAIADRVLVYVETGRVMS